MSNPSTHVLGITVPDGLRVTIRQFPSGFTLTSADAILSIEPRVTSFYEGAYDGQGIPGGPMIRFDFGMTRLAGMASDDISRLAAELGGRLASAADDWPSDEAHVWQFPMIEFRYEYVVSSQSK